MDTRTAKAYGVPSPGAGRPVSARGRLAAFHLPGTSRAGRRSIPLLQALVFVLSGLFCLLAVAIYVLGLVPRTFAVAEPCPVESERPLPTSLTILFHKMERAPNLPA
jgi:hypothetical protein